MRQALLIVGALISTTGAAQAQLSEVRQAIFGMD
jgi:hypothetical protein